MLQKWVVTFWTPCACFVSYLKIIYIFKNYYGYLEANCLRNSKMASNFSRPSGFWVIDQNMQNSILTLSSQTICFDTDYYVSKKCWWFRDSTQIMLTFGLQCSSPFTLSDRWFDVLLIINHLRSGSQLTMRSTFRIVKDIYNAFRAQRIIYVPHNPKNGPGCGVNFRLFITS